MEAGPSLVNASFLPLDVVHLLAHSFVAFPLHPVFNTVHYLLTAFALRNEPGGMQFAQRHPLASCVMTFLVASSGGILANLVLGGPPIECLLNVAAVQTCVVAWYLVFFSPLDVCYGLCHVKHLSLALWVVKELARAKKLYKGVLQASAVYPDSMLAMTAVGMLHGSGKQWGISWYRLVFDIQSDCKHELLTISYVTKSALLLSLMLAYNHTHSVMDPAPLVLLGGCVLVCVKLWCLQVRTFDPFVSPQGWAWQLLTCLSATHPCRDEVGVREGKERGGLRGEGRKQESEPQKSMEKHLKHD